MSDLTYPFLVLWDIAILGLQIVWPLLIAAFGLAAVAYFGEKDGAKTLWGWIFALGGLFLFLFNIRIITF